MASPKCGTPAVTQSLLDIPLRPWYNKGTEATKGKSMNGYKCMWNGKELDIYADTMFDAQEQATAEFQKVAGRKKVKGYEITVMLCEVNGEQYYHSTASI